MSTYYNYFLRTAPSIYSIKEFSVTKGGRGHYVCSFEPKLLSLATDWQGRSIQTGQEGHNLQAFCTLYIIIKVVA